MKHGNIPKLIKLMEVVLMITLFSVLTGCGEDSAAQIDTSDLPEMPPAFIKEQPDLPGELVGVCYEYSAGSMNYHTEFAIDVTNEEMVHCEYWGSSNSDMVQKDNVPITEDQWADVEKAVLDLWGVWEEIPDNVLNQKSDQEDEMFVLDGGDYNRWWLTWKTEEGLKKIQYYYPGDIRITTLSDILRNLADGKKRKITWYEAPVLSQATYINDKTDCSFQCTWWDGENSGYRLIVRFKDGAQEISIHEHVDDSIWETARPAFEWIDPDSFEDGSYSDPVVLNLKYSDQSYKSIKLDNKTVETIEPYLKILTLKYLEEKDN